MVNIKITVKSLNRRFMNYVSQLPSEEFARDYMIRTLAILGAIFLIAIWIFSLLSFSPEDYLVPLRYNSFLGVTALGAWYQLYIVPAILFLIFVLNVFLAHASYKKDKMVAYILMGTSIFAMVCGAAVVLNLSRILSR